MRILVKICGLRQVVEIEAAAESGADAIGLVLSPSPRQVAGLEVIRLFNAIPEGVERIAVLARAQAEERSLLAALPWDGVQVEAEGINEVQVPLGAFLLPSIRCAQGARDDLERIAEVVNRPSEPQRAGSLRGSVLLDSPAGGGRGQPLDPAHAREAFAAARDIGLGLILAGGLTPATVGPAIRELHPRGVDVSSGVESTRGVKDIGRIRAFLAAVRDAEQHLEPKVLA